jgi:hypothetical protein
MNSSALGISLFGALLFLYKESVMSFTYTETQTIVSGANYISVVRFLTDDTNSDAYDLSDEIITAKYTETNAIDTQTSRNYLTAIKCAEYMLVKYSKQVSFSADGVSMQLDKRIDAWRSILNNLRASWFSLSNTSGMIYANRCANFRE